MKKKKEQSVVLVLALVLELVGIGVIAYTAAKEGLGKFNWKDIALAGLLLFLLYVIYVQVRIRRAGRAIVEEKVKTATLVESLPQAVVVVDGENQIVTANAAACKLLSMDALDSMGKPFPDLFDAETAGRLRGGAAGKMDASVRGKRIRLTVAPLRGEAGRLAIVEEPDRGTSVEPVASRDEQNAALMRDLWKAVSGLDSDLEKMTPELRQRFAEALVRARKTINLFDEVGRLPKPKREREDVAELARQALERSMPLARAKGVRTELATRGDTSASVDREQLRRAIDEIVFNACSYTKQGAVKVSVEGGTRDVAVVCTDSGIGIPESEFGQVFDPGFVGENQLPETKSGRGIGLALAKRVVESHGGSIMVESRVGQGTRITLNIPRA